MAQAVIEEGPLEQYLRDAGELVELIPGISQSIIEEIDVHRHLYAFDTPAEEDSDEMEWRPRCVVVGLNLLESFLSSAAPSNSAVPFTERFKYTVISSSLLSTSLSSSQSTSTRSSLSESSLPGKLPHASLPPISLDLDRPASSSSIYQSPHYACLSLAVLATALLLSVGQNYLATLSLGGLSYLAYNLLTTPETPCHDYTSTTTALDELVAANGCWETTIQDAIQALEKEEASLLRSPSAAPAASSNALRVALHSALQTSRTQCDNVRQLFSALTCPSELSQLSEMYAPPSPVKSPLLLPEANPRPYSFPGRQLSPTTPENKRMTWNGSYTGLANAGSPTPSRRRDKHRSNLSTLFQGSATPSSPGNNTPITPFDTSPRPSLAQIAEDLQSPEHDEILLFSDDSPLFGSEALGLQRQKKADGLGAFELSRSPTYTSEYRSPRNQRFSTFTSSSRLTTIQPPRHPLSLYALNQALRSAVSSRRYTCSHLLALRFSDDEEEYWENVNSVIDLLTTTFGDEASRLGEALDLHERQHLRDQNPTPDISLEFPHRSKRTASYDRVSFAPMPSHLSRFAAHVAAITSALEDAREQLEECVAALKDDADGSPVKATPARHQRSSTQIWDQEVEEHRALQAYERLRKELGMALRECERGKPCLLEVVHPPAPASDDEGLEEDSSMSSLAHDITQDLYEPIDEEETAHADSSGFQTPELDPSEAPVDDVTSHLLSIQTLPPVGIEQVYEADTSNVVEFTRERSSLSREERIALMKQRRLNGVPSHSIAQGESGSDEKGDKREKWGPGGDVVQELKDVIWKVSERRRKMHESHLQHQEHRDDQHHHIEQPQPVTPMRSTTS
ncbi:hypothetical protein FA15DRAFT_663732 [Coprinopsis marcescibilis]|uniref:Uncharacterized protein n=1 Tax=Coprinopsis marcescibilis TaxID=230819 RepID=A0A5C3L9S4_COPMA|nr:hypothetical protein FA15DRAFT_663732 [Coprinopsis marcescibilis]